jgi:arylsulfatase A
MTEDLDTNMGVVLNELEKLGIAKNTYVIYMSDNGMKTTALKGGKSLLDEGGLRVPLVVSGPGINAKAYSNVPVVGYDIYATVLDLAAPGFALPKGVEGGSWKPVLLNGGKGTVTRPIDRMVWHHDVEVPHPQTAIRKGDYKLLYYWDTKESFLYNLEKDVLETTNLATQQPALASSMLADIKAHIRQALGDAKLAELESGKGGDATGGMGAGATGGMAAGGMAAGGMGAGGMAAGEAPAPGTSP